MRVCSMSFQLFQLITFPLSAHSETHQPSKHTHSWLACCLSLVHMLLFQQGDCGSGDAARLPTLLDSSHWNWTQRKRGPLDKATAVSPPISDLQASHLEWCIQLPPRDYTICTQCVKLRYLQTSACANKNCCAVGILWWLPLQCYGKYF